MCSLPSGPGWHWDSLITFSFPDSSVGKESACNTGDPSSIPGLGRSAGEGVVYPLQYPWSSLVSQLVKNPPAMQEAWVRSLNWEDPLEKGKATHCSILAWRMYSPWGSQESGMIERLPLITLTVVPTLLLTYNTPTGI